MAIVEQLACEIPGASFEIWDDLGHYPQIEDPERVARTLEKFWASVKDRPT
jgi:pimeloyl-ACP methyl ester carboxylesterase